MKEETSAVVGGGEGAAKACVVPPITIAVLLGFREMTVPEAVIWPPGVKVCDPITTADEESWVRTELPIVIITGVEPEAGVVWPGFPTTGVVPSARVVVVGFPCPG